VTGTTRWPALPDAPVALPEELAHGVFGKVHGAASDFRWIARSEGLPEDIKHEIVLGFEDAPRDGVAWRVLGRHAAAVHFYPSRARDAAGRSGMLEKYVVVWPLDDARIAALGALLLLPLVAAQGDELWWERAPGQPWSGLDFSLPLPRLHLPTALALPGGASPTVPAWRERLEAHIRQGQADLRVDGPDWLARVYATLLAGRRPVLLTPPRRRPLTPAALAALLLPLPHGSAARLSLCSWMPVARPTADTLGGRFDLVFGAFEPGLETRDQLPPDPVRAGRDLAERLLAATENASPAPRPSAPATWSPDPWQRPCDLPLTPSPDDASALVKQVYAFACDPARRWLSSAELSEPRRLSLPASDTRHGGLLRSWIEELRRYQPSVAEADRAAFDEHWRVKRDVLRALALLAFPTPARPEDFESAHVPPLLFVDAVERPANLDVLGSAKLDEAVRRSLACRPSPAKRHVERRLHEWSQSSSLVGQAWRRTLAGPRV
jgi:hypothetical protein